MRYIKINMVQSAERKVLVLGTQKNDGFLWDWVGQKIQKNIIPKNQVDIILSPEELQRKASDLQSEAWNVRIFLKKKLGKSFFNEMWYLSKSRW